MIVSNINNFYLRSIFILSIVLVIFSCRQIPENDKIVSRDASLKINIIGIEYGNIINETALSGENNTWGGGENL